MSDALRWPRATAGATARASRATARGTRRASAAARHRAGATARFIHRVTGASGAGGTGLGTLVELHGGRQHRRRVHRGLPRRDDLLQLVGDGGPRQGRAVPAHHDGTVRAARPGHRPGPGPHAAGPQVPPRGHSRSARAAVLGNVGRDQQPGHPAARRVRHPGPAEVLRGRPRLGRATPAARRDDAGQGERAVRAHHPHRLLGGRAHGGGHRVAGRRRLAAAGRRRSSTCSRWSWRSACPATWTSPSRPPRPRCRRRAGPAGLLGL